MLLKKSKPVLTRRVRKGRLLKFFLTQLYALCICPIRRHDSENVSCDLGYGAV
jgi:hypothetical protein